MVRTRRVLVAIALVAGLAASGTAAQQSRPQPPARDTPAQLGNTSPTPATGKITGRVLAADTGRPVPRARVLLNGPQAGGRGALTDASGTFELIDLPEGRYTLSVSKTGFVTLSYGQRRPLQAGTPLQLDAGEELKGIEFRLPRGSVISGHVFDENGDPMPGTMVRVLAYQYAQGSRQLVPAGGGQTDDRGEYRVWGLNPGDYFVSAAAQNFNIGGLRGAAAALLGRGGRGGPGGGPPFVPPQGLQGLQGPQASSSPDDPAPTAYAPTYYPGVPSVNEARAITLGLGAEVSEINFNVLLVRTSRISGHVTNPDGSATTNGNVTLTADGQPGPAGRAGPPFGNYGSRVQGDGQFTIAEVPPGRYTLRARGQTGARESVYADQPLTVSGGDLTDLLVVLTPGGSVSGTVTLQSTQASSSPDVTQVRITTQSDGFPGIGPNANGRVDKEGKFTLDGLPAGEHLIRSAQTPRGWTLKAVTVDGRDVTDSAIEIRSGQKLAGVNVILTDRLSEINGTVSDSQGSPLTELTVLAFPQDVSLWKPQARQIMTARPDQTGHFQMRGLPPGQYYLTTIDPVEQGEWFDPTFLDGQRTGAVRLTLLEGDVRTQDFKVSTR